jgi:hypothetical protein
MIIFKVQYYRFRRQRMKDSLGKGFIAVEKEVVPTAGRSGGSRVFKWGWLRQSLSLDFRW